MVRKLSFRSGPNGLELDGMRCSHYMLGLLMKAPSRLAKVEQGQIASGFPQSWLPGFAVVKCWTLLRIIVLSQPSLISQSRILHIPGGPCLQKSLGAPWIWTLGPDLSLSFPSLHWGLPQQSISVHWVNTLKLVWAVISLLIRTQAYLPHAVGGLNVSGLVHGSTSCLL